MLRQRAEDRRPPALVAVGGHEPFRLVIEKKPRALAAGQRLAVDLDAVARRHREGRRGESLAVHRDAARRDPRLGLAPRAKPGARHHLGDPFLVAGLVSGRLAAHRRPCEFVRLLSMAA